MEKRKIGATFNFGVQRISCMLKGLIITQIVLLAFTAQSWGDKVETKKVNCSKGQTITDALHDSDGKPITIEISGTCKENVVISRDDVTLVSYTSGATIQAADPNQNVITITGIRTVINGLSVTGGWNGINVEGGAAISNATIQNNLKSGIGFRNGGRGKVDNCTVQNNGRHGVVSEAGNAVVINSTISENGVAGIASGMGSSLKIGIGDKAGYARNTIRNNGGSGIYIGNGGSAWIGGNTISGNGTDPSSLYLREGVAVVGAIAFLAGSNTITENKRFGVLAFGSTVFLNNGAGLGILDIITNNISGNGISNNQCEIMATMGSTLDIADTLISPISTTTPINGLCVTMRSTARISGPATITNYQNGIVLSFGGSLFVEGFAPLTVTGNKNWGLSCSGNESSIQPFPIPGISGNGSLGTGGNIQDTCTGF